MFYMDISLLACKYRPVFHINYNEKYRPIDFNNNIKYYSQNGTPSTVQSIKNNSHHLKCDPVAYPGPLLSDVNNSPVYVTSTKITVDPVGSNPKTYYDFVYHQMYNYNGGTAIIGNMGKHEFDIETAIVRVEVDKNKEQIVEIFLSRHSSGVWLDPVNFKFKDNRPVIYIAKGSHALYERPGNHRRMFGFTNDFCEEGVEWEPKCVYLDMDNLPDTYQWANRKSNLTREIPMSFSRKSLRYTLNHKLYHYSSADDISKKLGDKKQVNVGVGFGVVVFFLFIVMVIVGVSWYIYGPVLLVGLGVSLRIITYERVK
jgi:hypothetical protein